MKKRVWLRGVIMMTVIIALASCAKESGRSAGSGKISYTAGTYSATVASMKGDLTVAVEVDDSKILSVAVTDIIDTHGIADRAVETIPGEIVSRQTLTVDTVSGATVTSMAILRAAELALDKSGVNRELLRPDREKAVKASGSDENYDVVIVGSGASGLSAAVRIASESNLKVLVLEKLSYYGGSARVCGGGIWAMGSEMNRKVGIDSTADEYISFMEKRSGKSLDRNLLTNIHDISGSTFDYLVKNGLPVDTNTPGVGHEESRLAIAWALSNGDEPYETGYGGKDIMDSVASIAEGLGVEIRTNAKVTSLIVEGDEVKGVAVEGKDKTYNVLAGKVILATGGFTRNRELVKEFAPEYENVMPFTGAGSTGDGIEMTRELGTQIVGDGMMGLTGVNMNLGYYGEIGWLIWYPQIYVNKEGRQFGMESTFYSETLPLVNSQTDHMCFGIADSTNSSADLYERAAGPYADTHAASGVVVKTDTLKKLAEELKIDEANLIAAAEANGVGNAPFYGIKIKPLFIGSIPGLKVSENCQVLDNRGEVIPNLYAVGELTFGNYFNNIYPASGSGMGTSVYSGALAGEHIVKEWAE